MASKTTQFISATRDSQGDYLWSNAANWTNGKPVNGDTVQLYFVSVDDIAGLSLASLTNSGETSIQADLTVSQVVSTVGCELFVQAGAAVTLGAITNFGGQQGVYVAVGTGAKLVDQSATDQGETFEAEEGGEIEISAVPASISTFDYAEVTVNGVLVGGGTIAFRRLAATNAMLLADVESGDVLEVPGTSVSAVTIGISALTVTTDQGTYAFTNVTYAATVRGYTAAVDPATGLVAITFNDVNAFQRNVNATSGPLNGDYLWSNAVNWTGGLPANGGGFTVGAAGYDDTAALRLLYLTWDKTGAEPEIFVTGGTLAITDLEETGSSGSALLEADATDAGAPVTVTVVQNDSHGALFEARGAGARFLDQSTAALIATSYAVDKGGLVELSDTPLATDIFTFTSNGTFAFQKPAATNLALIQGAGLGSTIEVPGGTVLGVTVGTNSLAITTDLGTYAFSAVDFAQPVLNTTTFHDATTGLEAITFRGVDVFTPTVSVNGEFLWSDPDNWSEGVPVNGDSVKILQELSIDSSGGTVFTESTSYDDIESLTLASVVDDSYLDVIGSTLAIGSLSAGSSPADIALIADASSGSPVTVTVSDNSLGTSQFGAVGSGGRLIDSTPVDPSTGQWPAYGNYYAALAGGFIEIPGPQQVEDIDYGGSENGAPGNGVGTIAFSVPETLSYTPILGLIPGDVLELPGTSVSVVAFGANSLSVTTDAGSYAFNNVTYASAVVGYTAAEDASTGLVAITFTGPDMFEPNVTAATGLFAGDYLWSNAANWSDGVPIDGNSVEVSTSGNSIDDVPNLSLAVLLLGYSEPAGFSGSAAGVTVMGNNLTIGTLEATPGQKYPGGVLEAFGDPGLPQGGPATITVNAGAGGIMDLDAYGIGAHVIDKTTPETRVLDVRDDEVSDDNEVETYQPLQAPDLVDLIGPFYGATTPGETIAFHDPGASNSGLLENVAAGDTLEVPGTVALSVTIGTSSLTVTTDAGSYDFTNVTYSSVYPVGTTTSFPDTTTGLVAISFAGLDVFEQNVAASSGPLSGYYLWSNAANWSDGVPVDGAAVALNDNENQGVDDLPALTLSSLALNGNQLYVVGTSLTVTTASGAGGSLVAGLLVSTPVTLTLGTVTGANVATFADGSGSRIVDQSKTDPGALHRADGGLTELSAPPNASSTLSYVAGSSGTFALDNPGATDAASFTGVAPGDVLELPGTTVSAVTFGANSLSVTTDAGTYVFTNVTYGRPVIGYTAAQDATTGLVAITFQGATNLAWSAAVSGTWSDASKWTPLGGGPPGAGQSASFATGAATPYTVTGNGAAGSVTVDQDSVTYQAGMLSLSVLPAGAVFGVSVLDGGSLTIGAGGSVTGVLPVDVASGSVLAIDQGGALTADSLTVAAGGTLALQNGASVSAIMLAGGEVEATAGAVAISNAIALAAAGATLAADAGASLDVTSGITEGGTPAALTTIGAVTLGAKSLTTGLRTIQGGTLTIAADGAAGTGDVAFAAGADATLAVADVYNFDNAVDGFQQGDTIVDLTETVYDVTVSNGSDFANVYVYGKGGYESILLGASLAADDTLHVTPSGMGTAISVTAPFHWAAAQNGAFSTSTDWTEAGGPPTLASRAVFSTGGAGYTVSGGGSAAGFTVTGDDVTFATGAFQVAAVQLHTATADVSFTPGSVFPGQVSTVSLLAGARLTIAAGAALSAAGTGSLDTGIPAAGGGTRQNAVAGLASVAGGSTLTVEGSYDEAETEVNAGTVALAAGAGFTGRLDFSGTGVLEALSGAVTFDQPIETGAAATLQADAGASLEVTGSITDIALTGGTTRSGSLDSTGNVTLAGAANTYTGGTTIQSGTLTIAADGAAGTGDVAFAAGGDATLAVADVANFDNAVDGFQQGDTIVDLTETVYDVTVSNGSDFANVYVYGKGDYESILLGASLAADDTLHVTPGGAGTAISVTAPFHWASAQNGAFATSTDWTEAGGPPSFASQAVFSTGGAGYTVSGGGSAAGFTVTGDDVTFTTGAFQVAAVQLHQFSADTSFKPGAVVPGQVYTVSLLAGADLTIAAGAALSATGTGSLDTGIPAAGGGTKQDAVAGLASVAGGSTLTVEGSYDEAETEVNAGTVALAAGAGFTGRLDFSGTGVLEALSGAVTFDQPIETGAAATLQADAGASLDVTGSITDIALTGGTTRSGSLTSTGNVTLAGAANTYTGGTTIQSGTLTIAADGAAGTGAITFAAGAAATLAVADPAGLSNTIGGFAAGDTIDLAGVTASSVALAAGNILKLALAGGGALAVQLDPAVNYGNASFHLADDGNGGSDLTLSHQDAAEVLPGRALWSAAGNWQAGLPDANADVAIPAGVGGSVDDLSNLVIDSLDIAANASLDVLGTLTTIANVVVGGDDPAGLPGSLMLESGAVLNTATLVLQTNGSLTLAAGSEVTAASVAVGDESSIALAGGLLDPPLPLSIAAGGSISGFGTIDGSVTVAGTLAAQGGLLQIDDAVSGTGTLAVGAGATLDLEGGASLTQDGVFTFDGLDGTLLVGAGQTISGTLRGFGYGDVLDFAGGTVTSSYANGILTVMSGDTAVATLKVENPAGTVGFTPETDGQGGTDIVATAFGSAGGDVHLTTFDGLHYDFQANGDFTLVRSTEPGNPFDIQIRTVAWDANKLTSVTIQAAARVGAHAISFLLDGSVKIDGIADSALNADHPKQLLGGGTLTALGSGAYRLDWTGKESLTVTNEGYCLNLDATVPGTDGPGSVQGLLGTLRGPANDLSLPDGTLLTQPVADATLLGAFADGWRVGLDQSLLGGTGGLPLNALGLPTSPGFLLADAPGELLTGSLGSTADTGMVIGGSLADLSRAVIANFAPRDFIDIKGLASAHAVFHYAPSANSGQLTMTDGFQSSTVTLMGPGASAAIQYRSDNDGGTLLWVG